jgi:hypothetical protein
VSNNDSERNLAEDIIKRLDALIRLFIEKNRTVNKKFSEGEVARILKSVGLTPTEIAKLIGKEKATEVSTFLYQKGKKEK